MVCPGGTTAMMKVELEIVRTSHPPAYFGPMQFMRSLFVLVMLFADVVVHAQQAVVPAGADAGGAGGSMSWTLGQIDPISTTSAGGTVAQGVQQPMEFLVLALSPDAAAPVIVAMPNPAHEGITLQLDDATATFYRVLDATGREVISGRSTGSSTYIPTATWSAATYHIQLLRNGTHMATVRVIKY